MVKKVLVSMVILCANIYAQEPVLEKKIGSMLMVGFHGTHAPKESQICKDIKRYDLGGVILFDYNPVDKTKPKNIASKQQLTELTQELQACSRDGKLLIAVDQEGERYNVSRVPMVFMVSFHRLQSLPRWTNKR